MITTHQFINSNALDTTINKPIHLILTSPPYPMIEMWDKCFGNLDTNIKTQLEQKNGKTAWRLMSDSVNAVFTNVTKSLTEGGFLIVNIGDATRSVGDEFALYSTHSLIDYHCVINLDLTKLPSIFWNKPSNKPNKYMGSGMLPAGAYVTNENEFVLIYRKGGKRSFKSKEDKLLRQQSAYFWEERNEWFSDIWRNIRGISQKIGSETRERSAAYPHELAYRLIAMYSCRGDTVLDPFAGLGTTLLSAMNLGRNSIGIEIEESLVKYGVKWLAESKDYCNEVTHRRIDRHIRFVKDQGKNLKHFNTNYGIPVVTSQETDLFLSKLQDVRAINDNTVVATYDEMSAA